MKRSKPGASATKPSRVSKKKAAEDENFAPEPPLVVSGTPEPIMKANPKKVGGVPVRSRHLATPAAAAARWHAPSSTRPPPTRLTPRRPTRTEQRKESEPRFLVRSTARTATRPNLSYPPATLPPRHRATATPEPTPLTPHPPRHSARPMR